MAGSALRITRFPPNQIRQIMWSHGHSTCSGRFLRRLYFQIQLLSWRRTNRLFPLFGLASHWQVNSSGSKHRRSFSSWAAEAAARLFRSCGMLRKSKDRYVKCRRPEFRNAVDAYTQAHLLRSSIKYRYCPLSEGDLASCCVHTHCKSSQQASLGLGLQRCGVRFESWQVMIKQLSPTKVFSTDRHAPVNHVDLEPHLWKQFHRPRRNWQYCRLLLSP